MQDHVAATAAGYWNRHTAAAAKMLLYYLHKLKETGAIPQYLPVYLNSPMAADATSLYSAHGEADAAEALRIRIGEHLHWQCCVPEYQQEEYLD